MTLWESVLSSRTSLRDETLMTKAGSGKVYHEHCMCIKIGTTAAVLRRRCRQQAFIPAAGRAEALQTARSSSANT
eukprot:m.24441 g.24441  ORF g.24441 m.24441 type:complete len:75 (-) comp11239_c0_seq1:2895-3119(-)